MWQPPSAGTVATHLGVGRRFLPTQAAQGPTVTQKNKQAKLDALLKVGTSLCLAQLDLHEACTEASSTSP